MAHVSAPKSSQSKLLSFCFYSCAHTNFIFFIRNFHVSAPKSNQSKLFSFCFYSFVHTNFILSIRNFHVSAPKSNQSKLFSFCFYSFVHTNFIFFIRNFHVSAPKSNQSKLFSFCFYSFVHTNFIFSIRNCHAKIGYIQVICSKQIRLCLLHHARISFSVLHVWASLKADKHIKPQVLSWKQGREGLMFEALLLRAMPFPKGIHSDSFFTLVRLSVTHASIAAAESNAVALKV